MVTQEVALGRVNSAKLRKDFGRFVVTAEGLLSVDSPWLNKMTKVFMFQAIESLRTVEKTSQT